MSFDSWTCLLVQDGPGLLPDQVMQALKAAACTLAINKVDTARIPNSDVCDGLITTEWQTHHVGACSGVLFCTHFDWQGGECRVNFLLSEADLATGAEILKAYEEGLDQSLSIGVGRIPCDELYRFKNLKAPRGVRLN